MCQKEMVPDDTREWVFPSNTTRNGEPLMSLISDAATRAGERAARFMKNPERPMLTLMSRGEDNTKFELRKVYDFARQGNSDFPFNEEEHSFGTRKTIDGICFVADDFYHEANEHGMVICARRLHSSQENESTLEIDEIIRSIYSHIKIVRAFYKELEYTGSIMVTANLDNIQEWKIQTEGMLGDQVPSIENTTMGRVTCQRLWIDETAGVIIALTERITWPFNAPIDGWQKSWKEQIESWEPSE